MHLPEDCSLIHWSLKVPGVDAVAGDEVILLEANDAGEAKNGEEGVGVVVAEAFGAGSDLAVEFEQRLALGFGGEKPAADESEVVVFVTSFGREQEAPAKQVDVAGGGDLWISGDGAAEPLGEIGMTVSPMEDAGEQGAAEVGIASEALGERAGFLRGEVGQFDAAGDVERFELSVPDEVAWAGDAEEAE